MNFKLNSSIKQEKEFDVIPMSVNTEIPNNKPEQSNKPDKDLKWSDYRKMNQSAITLLLDENIKQYAKYVGRWIWIEFPAKPDIKTLEFIKSIGFKWNKERQAWQHPCGKFTRYNPEIDPKYYYGTVPLKKNSFYDDVDK